MKKSIQNYGIASMIAFVGLLFSYTGAFAVAGEKRDVGAFDKLDVSGAFVITLVQGTEENVIVDAPSDILKLVITKVESGNLKIYNHKDYKSDEKINITVNFKNLSEIDCSGANVINSAGALKFNNFSFDASGACKANLEFSTNNLDIDMSGAVNAVMKGTATNVDLDISGAGKLMAADLAATDYDVDISGTGNAEINASKSLNVEVSGTGNVKYKGEPKITKEISGTGNVSQLH